MIRRNTRRRVGGLVAVALTLTLVATCGGDDDDTADDPPAATTAATQEPEPTTADGSSPAPDTSSTATTAGEPTDGGGDDGTGDVLRVSQGSPLVSLDPTKSTSSRDHAYLWLVYDSLLRFDRQTLEPMPGLVTEWEQPDDLTWNLTLREGVTFHDGTPFDAEAVKFNFERILAEDSTVRADFASVASVEVVDPLNVTLTLSEADATILTAMTDKGGIMVSPTAAQAPGADLGINPVGTGPWTFVSLDPGAKLIVEKNPDYWDTELPRVDRIEYSMITDPTTASNAFRAGEIDILADLRAPSEADALASEGFTVTQTASPETLFFIFNMQRPPLDNQQVREAINLALDRTELIEVSEFGRAEPTSSIFPKDYWAYPPSATDPERDVERAKELLAEAGFPDGVSFQTMVHTSSYDQRRAELVQSQLAEAGIDMEIIQLDLGVNALRFYVDEEFDSMLADFGGRPDPGTAYEVLFSSIGFLNPGKYVIPGFDEKLAEANAITDREERAKLFDELNQMLLDITRFVPVFGKPAISAISDSVNGWDPPANGKPLFLGVTLSD